MESRVVFGYKQVLFALCRQLSGLLVMLKAMSNVKPSYTVLFLMINNQVCIGLSSVIIIIKSRGIILLQGVYECMYLVLTLSCQWFV